MSAEHGQCSKSLILKLPPTSLLVKSNVCEGFGSREKVPDGVQKVLAKCSAPQKRKERLSNKKQDTDKASDKSPDKKGE